MEYLRHQRTLERERRKRDSASVSPELVERVKAAIAQLPEMRSDRVCAAWEVVDGDIPSSAVAEKMIGRLISDELA